MNYCESCGKEDVKTVKAADAKMCDQCATNIDREVDHCPDHKASK